MHKLQVLIVFLRHGFIWLNVLSKVFILGEEIVAGDDLYGGTDRLLSQVVPKTGAIVKLVHTFG